jgi:predicted transcriptional regulator of viral defense system
VTLEAYATLSRLGRVLRTGEAAAALQTTLSQASRVLRRMQEAGFARRVRQGVWVIGREDIDPRILAEELTHPYPAYISFISALGAHGMIDQIPRDITVASLDKARRIATAFGTFAVRHVPPELFGGWTELNGVKLATPEKALVDHAYVSAVHLGRQRRLPELDLPKRFSRRELRRWIARIPSARVRTLTERGVEEALDRAVR